MILRFIVRLLRARPDKPGVYRIRNVQNDMEYIGATTRTMRERWKLHRDALRSQRHVNKRLQADWNTYGEAAFVFEVIEVVWDWGPVFERERYWQDKDFDASKRYNPSNAPRSKINVDDPYIRGKLDVLLIAFLDSRQTPYTSPEIMKRRLIKLVYGFSWSDDPESAYQQLSVRLEADIARAEQSAAARSALAR